LRESKLNYDQFLAPPAIMKAQRFLREHSSILAEAEKTYGVDRCVIVGILLVETQLGNYTGRTPTLAVFSTFALMDERRNRDKVWSLLTAQDRKRWGREAFDAKLEKRAEWAYQEICALARLASSQSVRVESLHGSVMGAVGWPQFLPTSLVRYGADGNNDGRIDLYESKDAVFSIANYLRGHGWSQARTRAEKEDVIHHYNKSRPYVNAVLGVADRIR
jgi:membrane-bound lytic murein transglycosylase B